MTIQEIRNTPEIVDFMLDKSVITDSRMKLRKRLEEICELAIKALDREPCDHVPDTNVGELIKNVLETLRDMDNAIDVICELDVDAVLDQMEVDG